jgi:hypothetical protein
MTLFRRTSTNEQSSTKQPQQEATDKAAEPVVTPFTVADDEATAVHLQMLGLGPGATWDEITEAHARLVSDLTPGPNASHRNVSLAEQFLSEVNQAFASLRMQSVA